MTYHPAVLAAHAEFGGDLEAMQALYDRPDHEKTITRLEREKEELRKERDAARITARAARRLISATHTNAVKHDNCQTPYCNICEGGLFVCADCGAAEIETEERICTAPVTRAETADRQLAERDAELARVLTLLQWAHDTLYEINLSNYDHDEVCKLNYASVEVILGIAPILGETHGKTPEWWRATLTREEAEKICARLEFDASWDKAGHGYYSLKRQLAASPSTTGER